MNNNFRILALQQKDISMNLTIYYSATVHTILEMLNSIIFMLMRVYLSKY
jgi:hypothetical protein